MAWLGSVTAGVRIYGPNASVAQDLEPEYIMVSDDGKTAWVTLQENNAVATVDIATATVTSIKALGTKDHSLTGYGLERVGGVMVYDVTNPFAPTYDLSEHPDG